MCIASSDIPTFSRTFASQARGSEESSLEETVFGKLKLRNSKRVAERENRHIYNQYVIRVNDQRDDLRTFLLENEIGSDIYYPVPLHLQECFAYLEYKEGDFPVAEAAASQTLAIPVYPELSHDQQVYVVEKIKEFYS